MKRFLFISLCVVSLSLAFADKSLADNNSDCNDACTVSNYERGYESVPNQCTSTSKVIRVEVPLPEVGSQVLCCCESKIKGCQNPNQTCSNYPGGNHTAPSGNPPTCPNGTLVTDASGDRCCCGHVSPMY